MIDILSICQEAADMTAAARPDDLFDKAVQHNAVFLSVAKTELDSLMRFGDWQALIKEASFYTVSGKTFYAFDEIVLDFYALVHNTIYVKDGLKKVIGALTSEDFMREKYFSNGGVEIAFKVENNGFRFLNDPGDGIQIVFMYRSNAVCIDAKTLEPKSVLSKNTDVPIFDAYLVKLGIIWRFLKRSGLDYEEEYNEYQKELKKRFGLETAPKDICLAKNEFNLDGNHAVQIVFKG